LNLDPRHIQIGIEASDWQEAIELACEPLILDNFVNNLYVKDVIDRELIWPTGLPVKPIAVAIPHAESRVNIKESTIAAAVLKEKVKFREAGGDIDDYVDVKIVFILAIKDSTHQLEVLRRLMNAFSNGETLKALISARNSYEFAELFNAAR